MVFIDDPTYKAILNLMFIVIIHIVVFLKGEKDEKSKVLLGKRSNKPA